MPRAGAVGDVLEGSQRHTDRGKDTLANFLRTGGFGELTVCEMGNAWEMKRRSPVQNTRTLRGTTEYDMCHLGDTERLGKRQA
jgi:hypothetical protein